MGKNIGNGRVYYVEPNYSSASYSHNVVKSGDGVDVNTNQLTTYLTPPDLTDYCIAVDLTARIHSRSTDGTMKDGDTAITIHWEGGKSKVTFLRGSSVTYNKQTLIDENTKMTEANTKNYWTTAPYEYTTFQDINSDKMANTEMFGISSIDIAYNNYMVPEVTIEFVDIKGLSLFAAEELRHNITRDGIKGNADDDIAGSFFKCFFTFPYPQFDLMVKGFYGHPTTYELTCSDFRARFDCKTGNFGATAKFVGYAYSLLNDVTINALTAAPYDDMVGAKYWADKKSQGIFVLDSGEEMKTLVEIAEAWKDIKEAMESSSQTDEDVQKAKTLSEESVKYVNELNTIEKVMTAFQTRISNDKNAQYIPYNEGASAVVIIPINSSLNVPNEAEMASKEGSAKPEGEEDNGTVYNLQVVDKKYADVKKYIDKKTKGPTPSDKTHKFYVVDTSAQRNSIKEQQARVNQEQNETDLRIADKNNKLQEQKLGFKPTIKNVTKVVLAHLDTLNHCIYETAREVGSRTRTVSQMGLDSVDLKGTDNVGPFPRVIIEKTDNNGNTVKEDGWLGDLTSDAVAPEIKLVHGLLNGVYKIESALTSVSEALNEDRSAEGEPTSEGTAPRCTEEVATCVTDFLDTNLKRIDSHKPDFNDKSSVAACMGVSAMASLGANPTNSEYMHAARDMGIADALNFVKRYPTPTQTFKDSLNGGSFSADDVIKCLSGKESEKYKLGGKYAWGNGEPLFKEESYKSQNYYVFNMYNNRTLPLTSGWKDADFTANNTLTVQDTKFGCNNVLFVYKDYQKYSLASNLCSKSDNDEWNGKTIASAITRPFSISNYRSNYFSIEGKDAFGYKFIHSKDFDEGAKYITHGKGTCTFGNTKPTDFSFTAFDSKNKGKEGTFYDEPFDTIYSIKGNESQKYTRESGSFSALMRDNNNIDASEFTIPMFRGFLKGRITNKCSLFGQSLYYNQSTNNAKALLFLQSLTHYNESAWTFWKENDKGGFDFLKVINEICNTSRTMSFIPYCGALLAGAYLWRNSKMTKGGDPINDGGTKHITCGKKETTVLGQTIRSDFFKLRQDVKKALINLFEEWVKTEFAQIQSKFELKGNKVNAEFVNWLSTNLNSAKNYTAFMGKNGHGGWSKRPISAQTETKTFEKFLSFYFDENFFENYISISAVDNDGLRLFNRESSSAVDNVTKLWVQPAALIKTTEYLTQDSNNKFRIRREIFKTYAEGFINTLKTRYENVSPTADADSPLASGGESLNGSGEVQVTETDVNIKISLYKYLKILYDRWLSGNPEDKWQIKPLTDTTDENRSFYQHWHFIDSFYNNIGDDIFVNLKDFSEVLISCQTNYQYSLLSFLSLEYSKTQFSLHTVQNFLNLTGKDDGGERLSDLFTPIPYQSMNFSNLDTIPDFILLYGYETSAHIGDEEYEDDGFDISNEATLPTPIKSKNMANGLPVPAFGVSYGMQYQSYFKNINVSMDQPIVTEQSIRAQYMIANADQPTDGGSDSGAAGRNVTALGQDLYTIYSNNSYTCEVTMMGCAYIQPLMYFQLNNIPMFHGAYLIEKVTHHIEPGNMETKFVGVRMANTQTPKVNGWWVSKKNGEGAVDEGQRLDRQAEEASIYNDCAYKVFGVGSGGDGPTCSISELNMTLVQYEAKVGGKFKMSQGANGPTQGYGNFNGSQHTVLDVLAHCIMMEHGVDDIIGAKSTALVIYNRWNKFGKNFTKTLVRGQHELAWTSGFKGNNEKARNLIIEMFTKGPSSLKGQTATVKHPCLVYQSNKLTGAETKTKTIELSDLQMTYFYVCPTYHYWKGHGKNDIVYHKYGEYSIEAGTENENLKHTPNSTYAYQHEGGSLGHIYLGTANGEKYWKPIPPKQPTKEETKNPSDLAISLFDAIKSTCDFSKEIQLKEIKMEKGNTPNEFYITTTPSSGLVQVFDVALNAYYDYTNKLAWCVNSSDGGACPTKVLIEAAEATKKHLIGVASKGGNGNWEFLNQAEGLNDLFYMSLKKKYGVISSSNANVFKDDCRNFSTITAQANATWYDKVNTLLNKDLTSCPTNSSSVDAAYSNVPLVMGKNGIDLGKTRNDCIKRLGYSGNPSKAQIEARLTSFQVDAVNKKGQQTKLWLQLLTELQPEVVKIFKEIAETTDFKVYSVGGYCYRWINSSSGPVVGTLSCHSFGVAIDINPDVNGWNQAGSDSNTSMRTTSHKVVQIFAKYGWYWGGSWRKGKDYMHFCKVNG